MLYCHRNAPDQLKEVHAMQQEQYIQMIKDLLTQCQDLDLLDLIYKLLVAN